MAHPRITGLVESSLYVADLDAAEAFYRRVFGFETLLADDRMRGMGVVPGSQILLLFRHGGSVEPSRTPGGTIPAHDSRGRQHVCFAIPRRELPAWEAHLPALAVPVESRVEWPYGAVSLYFRDPDGHSVEVATPGMWAIY